MGMIEAWIQSVLPGVYVKSLMIGANPDQDRSNGFFMNVNDQIEFATAQIRNDTILSLGFNAIGFSQGGQFLRAYVERYNNPPVWNLISVGGQHQGVFGLPQCPGNNSVICEEVRRLLNLGVYLPYVQDHLVQAEYWQDPNNEDEYLNKSIFLADINNARPQKNPLYATNLKTLTGFYMVMFTLDTMVQPRISEWFGWYTPGSDRDTIPYNETQLYIEDWIGLRALDEAGKVFFISCVGNHLQFNETWFIDNIVPALNNTLKPPL